MGDQAAQRRNNPTRHAAPDQQGNHHQHKRDEQKEVLQPFQAGNQLLPATLCLTPTLLLKAGIVFIEICLKRLNRNCKERVDGVSLAQAVRLFLNTAIKTLITLNQAVVFMRGHCKPGIPGRF